MLSRTNRISNDRLIEKLQKRGKIFKTTHFIFKFLPSDLAGSKFAILITKKIAPKAVDRNRLKRQINESIRLNLSELKAPVVCLIIQKKGAPQKLEYSIIDAEIKDFINHSAS